MSIFNNRLDRLERRGPRNTGAGFGPSQPGGYENYASFNLPLNDLGSGLVDTVPIFAAGSPTATFTRATVKWTKLATGLWTEVASGSAASCYLGADTAVGVYGGYFAEGAGTQLVTPTASIRDMTNAAWVAGATLTVAKTGTGIDGVSNSCSRLTGGAVSATNTIFQTLTAAASSRTYSVWLKRVTGTGTINITQTGGTSYTDVTSQINSSTFTRVSLTESDLNAAFGIQVVTSGDVILADFNQFEAGALATSPMASAGAARNTDDLRYVISGNINAASGSIYAECTGVAGGYILSATNNEIPLFSSGGTQIRFFDGTNNLTGTTWNISRTTIGKIAISYSGVLGKTFADGATATATTFDGEMVSGTSFFLGNQSASAPFSYGTIRNVRIYNRVLSDAELQVMTT